MLTQNGQQTTKLQVADGLFVEVTSHKDFQFTLPTKDVARGYGIKGSGIRLMKMRHDDELLEGKHFISGVSNSNGKKETLWTKAGIIRLGFFIRSERAKMFREWAEQLILDKTAGVSRPILTKEIDKAGFKIIDNKVSIAFIRYAGKEWFNVNDLLKYFGYKSRNSTHLIKRISKENARKFDLHDGTSYNFEWYLNNNGVEEAIRTAQKNITDKHIKDIYRDLFGINNFNPVPSMEDFEDTIMSLIQVEPAELRAKLTQRFLSLKAIGGLKDA